MSWFFPLTASSTGGGGDFYALPSDRQAFWQPGVTYNGGIPARSTTTIVTPSGTDEDSTRINPVIAAASDGDTILLSSGTFYFSSYTGIIIDRSNITLRGAGPDKTVLVQKPDRGGVYRRWEEGFRCETSHPMIRIGASEFPHWASTTAADLSADATDGSTFVVLSTVGGTAAAQGFSSGQYVLVDEQHFFDGVSTWANKPAISSAANTFQVWESDRISWLWHKNSSGETRGGDHFSTAVPDRFGVGQSPPNNALGWFARGEGRNYGEVKRITSVSGQTVNFESPLHTSYRTSHAAQLVRADVAPVEGVGIEDLAITHTPGGGPLGFFFAHKSWAKNLEISNWVAGVRVQLSYRCELRDSYMHKCAWPVPGGGGYAVNLSFQTSDFLMENNTIIDCNKPMVANSAGAGCVCGYNYLDDAQIWNIPMSSGLGIWQEAHANWSHFAASHHGLLEGNETANAESDYTHGSALFHTWFRNWFKGTRRNLDGLQNSRCIGLSFGSRWMSLVGNVLGVSGAMSGWTYTSDTGSFFNGIYQQMLKIGYDPGEFNQHQDTRVSETVILAENWDHLSSTRKDPSTSTMPDSFYCSSKPPFFDSTHTWPWVNPITGFTGTLPARARLDAIYPGRYRWDDFGRSLDCSGQVDVAPSPSTSGTSLTLRLDADKSYPATPFLARVWPFPNHPSSVNAELVTVSTRSGDVLTITRAVGGSTAVSISSGYKLALTPSVLGPEWSTAWAGLGIDAYTVVSTVNASEAGAWYTGLKPTNDQFVQVVFLRDADGGLITRLSTTPAGLQFYVTTFRGSAINTYRYVSSAGYTQIDAQSGYNTNVGQIGRVEWRGSTCRVLYNSSQVATFSDTLFSSGYTGLYSYDTAYQVDGFICGDW